MNKKNDEEKVECCYCKRQVLLEDTMDFEGDIICDDCHRKLISKTFRES